MKALIVTTRIVLDPDAMLDAEEKGITDADIIREVKGHVSSAVGNRNIIDAGWILDAEVVDIIKED